MEFKEILVPFNKRYPIEKTTNLLKSFGFQAAFLLFIVRNREKLFILENQPKSEINEIPELLP